MNLDPILDFRECWCIKCRVGESDEQAKFGFLIATAIAYRAKFKKSYFTQI